MAIVQRLDDHEVEVDLMSQDCRVVDIYLVTATWSFAHPVILNQDPVPTGYIATLIHFFEIMYHSSKLVYHDMIYHTDYL